MYLDEEVAEGNLQSPWRRGDVVLKVLPSMKGKMARGKRTCKRLHVTRPSSQSSWARPGDKVAGRLAEVRGSAEKGGTGMWMVF